jgi:hypothetical protein
MTKPLLFALLGLFSLTGCDNDSDDIRPANYDILAMETGHWEWERTAFMVPQYTPATEGYTRQLIFKADKKLLLRRDKQPEELISYQLAVSSGGMPTITYQTKETKLANSDVKYYHVTQQNGQQILQLTGEGAAADAGGYETYHWVKE